MPGDGRSAGSRQRPAYSHRLAPLTWGTDVTPLTEAEVERLIRVQADAMGRQDWETLATVNTPSRVADARRRAARHSIKPQTSSDRSEMPMEVRNISREGERCVATVEVGGGVGEFTFVPSASAWLISDSRPLLPPR